MNFIKYLLHKINGGLKRIIIFFYPDAFPSTGDDLVSPERDVLLPYLQGIGLDIGCGSRKIHPQAIGIDIVGGGQIGKYGSEKRRISQADICISGDNLYIFADNVMDYVVAKHSLEHFDGPLKALSEWKRVLKKGGVLGIVLPDEEFVDTMSLDPTHKHIFTQKKIKLLLKKVGGFQIKEIGVCIPNWSFYCIAIKK